MRAIIGNQLKLYLGAVMVLLFCVTVCTWAIAGTSEQESKCPDLIKLKQWRVSEGGNGHWYGIIPVRLMWIEADSAAPTLEHEGMVGYLATITSQAENDFILNQIISGTHQPSVVDQFWLGGTWLNGAWRWQTGEAFNFIKWAPGEPNNVPNESVMAIWGFNETDPRRPAGFWNNAPPDTSFWSEHLFWTMVEFGDIEQTETLEVAFDIKPGSCPNPLIVKPDNMSMHDNSKDIDDGLIMSGSTYGTNCDPVVPVAILGDVGFNVREIDVTTISINGLFPLRHDYHDVSAPVLNSQDICDCTEDGPDGYCDLVLKFDRIAIGTSLGMVSNNDIVPLTIRGQLIDGTPFEGTDCVIIKRNPGQNPGTELLVPEEFATIQAAINAAVTGDVVLVSPGVYEESINFLGKAIEVKSTAGPLVTTIQDGNSEHLVLFDHGEGVSSVLEGFTLQGGRIAIWCRDSGPTIRGNILDAQTRYDYAALVLSGPSYGTIGHSPAVIVNNTIVNGVNGCIAAWSYEPATIMNNILAFSGHYAIHLQRPAVQPIIGYNAVYGMPDPYQNIDDPGPGSFLADPMIDTDYSLLPNSPCIDGGNPDASYNDPDGSRNDIGALPSLMTGPSNELLVPGEYATIQAAINAAVSGDVVLVSPGVYEESINFLGKAIEVKSTAGPLVTTIEDGNSEHLVLFDHGEGVSSVLEGFTLQGGRIAIWCRDSGPTIRGNILDAQTRHDYAALVLSGPSYGTIGHSPAVIVNNTIVNSENGCIAAWSWEPATIMNNIMAFSGRYAIHLQRPAIQPILGYNAVYGMPDPYFNIDDPGIGTFLADPMINTDYSLLPNSPCIDGGNPDASYNDPDGSRNDIGALPSANGSISETDETLSMLSEAYPNPFNPSTTIEYNLPSQSRIEVAIYNVLGQKVRTLVQGVKPAGKHRVVWEGVDQSGKSVASGIYFYRIAAGAKVETKKAMLLK